MILAGYADERGMERARSLVAGLGAVVETYSPAPPVGEAGGEAGSVLRVVALGAGLAGAGVAFWVQAYAAWSYPINVGGRPLVAWPSFVPSAFEVGVLSAVVAVVVGFLVLCGLPGLYDAVDESLAVRRASRDLWFVVVRGGGEGVRGLLAGCGPVVVDEVAG